MEQERSPGNVLAKQIVATKSEREACEAELESLPPWRMLKRSELERRLEAIREREENLLEQMGGTPQRN